MSIKTLNGECLCGIVSWQMKGPYEFLECVNAPDVGK